MVSDRSPWGNEAQRTFNAKSEDERIATGDFIEVATQLRGLSGKRDLIRK